MYDKIRNNKLVKAIYAFNGVDISKDPEDPYVHMSCFAHAARIREEETKKEMEKRHEESQAYYQRLEAILADAEKILMSDD